MTSSSTLAGNRGAIVSVRGYLYQFAKIIEYLLLAVDGDAVVCVETFDDIAIETSDGGRQLVQVRHRAARFSLLAEPGLKLLESWLEPNLPPNATFAFVSTQHLVNGHFVLPDSDNDLSDSDIDSIRAKLTDKVDGLRKKEFKKLRKVLSDAVEFKTFWGRIKWSVGQDEEKGGIDSLTIAMESLEKTARKEFGEWGEARVLPWLAAVALSAADLRVDQRRWTRKRLKEVDSKTYQALVDAMYDLREVERSSRATAQAASGREIDALETATALGSRQGFPSSAAFRGVAAAVLAAHRSFPLRHPGEWCVSDAVFSLDGSRVITACYDKMVRVWDAYSHRLLSESSEHKAFLYKLALSPDGDIVAATCDDGSVALWDLRIGSLSKVLGPVVPSRGRPRNVAFNATGDILLTVTAGAVFLWDVGSGDVCRKVEDGVVAACLSSAGGLITLHANGMLRVSDASTLSALAEFTQPADNAAGVVASADSQHLLSWSRYEAWLRDQSGAARAHFALSGVARDGVFSPDGTRFLLTGGDGMARLFDTTSGGLVSPLHGHLGPVEGGSFSSDGTLVVTAGYDGIARIFRTRDGFPLGVLEGHKKFVFAARFAPDGHRVLTASDDGDARLWTIPGDGLQNLRGHTKAVWSCIPSASGALVLTASADGSARLFDAVSEKLVRRIDAASRAFDVCFLHNDAWVATADNNGPARVWDAASGALHQEIEPEASALFPSPSGRLLAIVSDRQRLSLWHVESLICVSRIDGLCDEPFVHIECLEFAPDESFLVAGLSDGTLVSWSLIGPRHHEKWAANPARISSINTVAFSPSGNCFVSGGDDEVIRMWITGSHTPCGTFRGHANIVTTACFSRDGQTLLTASRDATARLWDVENFVEYTLLAGHLDQIDIATFSPDGRYVLTASKDMTARLWDASDGQTIATYQHRGAVVDARFFPDGAHVVTASYEGGVQVNPASFEQFAVTAKKLLADTRPDKDL